MALPAVLVAMGLGLTWQGVRAIDRTAVRDARARFEMLGSRVKALTLRQLNLFAYGLKGARGVFAASKSVERDGFRAYAASRDMAMEFPGALGVGYIERVPRERLAAFVESTRADGVPDFAVDSAGDHATLMVVKYFETAGAGDRLLGLDVGGDSRWREAAEAGVRTGDVAATAPVEFHKQGVPVRGSVCLLAVYRHGPKPETAAEREAACVGWVFIPAVLAGVVGEVGAIAEGLVDIEVFDGPARSEFLLYDADGHLHGVRGEITAGAYASRAFHDDHRFGFGERSWTLRTSTTPAFDRTIYTTASSWVILGGGVGSAMLGLLAWSLRRTAARARTLATGMTADLRLQAMELDRLAMVVRRTNNAAIVTDANRKIVWVNEGFTRLTGYTLDEVRGRSPGSFLQFEKTDRATAERMAGCARRGEACRVEILNRAKNGREYWLDVDIQPLHDDAGVLSGFMAIESDITHLVEHRNRLASMFAAMAEGVVVQSVGGEIIEANPAAERILGLSRDDLMGRKPTGPRWQAVDEYGADLPGESHPISHTLTTGESVRGMVMGVCTPEGETRWLSVSTEAVRGADGAVTSAVASFTDITSRRHNDDYLNRVLGQARAAAQAKSEFLANMSHEIRTPMTAILGYTDLLYEDGDLARAPSPRIEYINTIRRNGEHLLSIINDILDLAKIEAGKMSVEMISASPAQIVEDVASLMRVRSKGKGISLEVVYETSVPETIRTDPTRLKQVLLNLVGNAIKFTELGGVTLRIGLERFNPAGPAMRFSIEDTGLGLTQDQMERLFGAFEQADASTSRKFGGTGLGLSISKRLAEMLGGDITVSSEPGKGSVFTAVVGIGSLDGTRLIERERAGIVVAESAKVVSEPTMALKGMRILLAEDGPDNQRLISFHLKKAGAEVKVAENGRLAVEALTTTGTMEGPLADPPMFDLLLTDMQMPELDGYGAARMLRAKGCTMPIVALTAHAMAGDAEKCIEAGCDAYASKPIVKDKLLATCREAVEARGLRAG